MKTRFRDRGFTLVELLVVIAIIGILIGMLLPAIQAVREAASRTSCANKVHQIAIAIHNYESAHQSFPPGVVDDDDNHQQALTNGFVYLLPYIEQGNLYDQYDRDQAWSAGGNVALAKHRLSVLLCPSNGGSVPQNGGLEGSPTDYAFCKGDLAYLSRNRQSTGLFDINSKTRFSDISDGSSSTFMLGEAASNPDIPASAT